MLVHFLVKAHLSPSAATSLACVAAVIAGLPIGIPGWQPMVVMKEHDSSATPAQQFRDERRNNVAFALAAVAALVIAVSVLGWFFGGLAVGLLLGTFAAIIVDRLSMAWWSYLLATLILSAAGTFPFRLAEFLQDSYDYGLLRRVGGVYQFRHAGFQDYLAGVPGPTAQTAPSEHPRASALLSSPPSPRGRYPAAARATRSASATLANPPPGAARAQPEPSGVHIVDHPLPLGSAAGDVLGGHRGCVCYVLLTLGCLPLSTDYPFDR